MHQSDQIARKIPFQVRVKHGSDNGVRHAIQSISVIANL